MESASSAELLAVRTSHEQPQTRVVFDLSAAADYRVFRMRNPDRLVIDLTDARAKGNLGAHVSAGTTLKRLRHAVRNKRDLRVVLDLHHRATVDHRKLAPRGDLGHRLVFDLAPEGAASKPSKLAAAPASAKASESKSVAKRSVAKPVIARQAAAPVNRAGRDVVVAIDAGHGGADVGAIGPSGAYEKDITLAVARELAAIIRKQPGMTAFLTRNSDRYLKLRERMDRAREKRADLFISVHADAFRDARVKGSSVYVLSQRGASSEAAKWLADNENAADLVGGVSLDDKDHVLKSVLIDLSQTASIESSIDVGKHVLAALKRLGPVHKKEIQHAGFMVLKSPDIPSILVETAFISNPAEEKRLRSRQFRAKLANALYVGVAEYFHDNPPPGTRLAANREHKVARGDTLSAIANRYAVSVSSLKLANNLATELVRTGEVLRIP